MWEIKQLSIWTSSNTSVIKGRIYQIQFTIMLIYQLFAQNIFWTCSKAPLIPDKKLFFCLFIISYPFQNIKEAFKKCKFLIFKAKWKIGCTENDFRFYSMYQLLLFWHFLINPEYLRNFVCLIKLCHIFEGPIQ